MAGKPLKNVVARPQAAAESVVANTVYALATGIAFVLIAVAGVLQGMRTTVSPADGPLLLLFRERLAIPPCLAAIAE